MRLGGRRDRGENSDDADALGPAPSAERPVLRRLRRVGRDFLRLPPPLTLLLLYAAFVVVGAVLLKLPIAQEATATAVTWSDVIFMSASAVTVTGLAVVDPALTFSLFGEAVLMILIQVGGLGLMVFAVLILSILGFPIGLPGSITLREDLGQTSLHELGRLVRLIAFVFFVCEAVGVFALSFVFVPDLGWGPGLWHALFFSISAFNNAGFALFPDSLTRYALDPVINIAVPALFIVGGIGFAVIADLNRHRRSWRALWWPRWRPLMLHSKLMLVGTAALIIWPLVTFAILEWSNPGTLGLYDSWQDKLTVAWFQAVTPRTAGFNTADFAAVHDATAFMTITLMLVGGGPTSTAGGIKVTTLICLLLATYAFFRRRSELNAFGRSLSLEDVMRVTALVSVAILFVAVATFVISVSHDGEFFDLIFEVASAFGTVGLSRGATAELDEIGRAVIVILMFVGRVGPLTLGFFLATRTQPRVRYPKSAVFLG
ncbi:potassium transporter TrkG [Acuticoccus sp. MNP-M23]|uniref:TrkH family potassium uptake protein n=1 Tax=Acuticoccus sp. MNP-M23 TaxID=3072793 RepID=UPI00281535E0|nr:potassium transporter TrkG [Acuticoccus sp. MNP-M23]WMS44241.1 potassium transporter TrkG [Acuticoccus sp. MNP-M23]